MDLERVNNFCRVACFLGAALALIVLLAVVAADKKNHDTGRPKTEKIPD